VSVWRLFVTNPECDWQPVDAFDDLAAAADRIRQMEGYPATGIFLEFYIDPQTSDIEALSHFEHTGQRNRYVILRAAQ
jgi:hypothetical protein